MRMENQRAAFVRVSILVGRSSSHFLYSSLKGITCLAIKLATGVAYRKAKQCSGQVVSRTSIKPARYGAIVIAPDVDFSFSSSINEITAPHSRSETIEAKTVFAELNLCEKIRRARNKKIKQATHRKAGEIKMGVQVLVRNKILETLQVSSTKASVHLLLFGLIVSSGASHAFTYPATCIQSGGTLFDCNQDYIQDGPVTCNIQGSSAASGSTVDDCYQATINKFSQYLSTVDSGTIPRIIYSAIPDPTPRVKQLVFGGLYSIPNGMFVIEGGYFSERLATVNGQSSILVHRTFAWVKDNLSSLTWLGDERWKAKNCTGICWG